jgi:hypothetical protein
VHSWNLFFLALLFGFSNLVGDSRTPVWLAGILPQSLQRVLKSKKKKKKKKKKLENIFICK